MTDTDVSGRDRIIEGYNVTYWHAAYRILESRFRKLSARYDALRSPGGDGELVKRGWSLYSLGETYFTQGGARVKFVEIANPGTSYETMADENGVHRYTRRDYGRVTGSPFDYSDPRNVPPPSALSAAEATSAGTKCACGVMSEQDCNDLPSLRHCGGAEATSAPAPVSGEREELAKKLDWTAEVLRGTDNPNHAAVVAQAATALRAPHGLPGWPEYQHMENDVYNICVDVKNEEMTPLEGARAILSRLTASREDGKNG